MLFPKSYYRIKEVADRWHCDVDDVLYLAEAGKLAIALPPDRSGQFCYILNPTDFSKTTSGKEANEVEVVLVATTPECARHLSVDADGKILSDEVVEAMTDDDREATLLRQESVKKLHFGNRRYSVDNLVVTHEERERFERENAKSVDPGSKNPQDSDPADPMPSSPMPADTALACDQLTLLKPQERYSRKDEFCREVFRAYASAKQKRPNANQMWLFVDKTTFKDVKDKAKKEITLTDGTEIKRTGMRDWLEEQEKWVKEQNTKRD